MSLIICNTEHDELFASAPSSLQVSKLPKELRSAHQLCFSSDSSKLFAASCQSSVVVVAVSQLECRYLGTLQHKSGEWELWFSRVLENAEQLFLGDDAKFRCHKLGFL